MGGMMRGPQSHTLNPQDSRFMITTPSGLQYDDTVSGTGEAALSGQHVNVHYTG